MNECETKHELRPPKLPHSEKTPMMEIDTVSKLMHDRMRVLCEEAGVSSGYRRVLFVLAHRDGITQSELTRFAHVSAPSVSVTVEKMEREGLLVRTPDDKDARQLRLSLTEAGLALDKKIIECIKLAEKEALEGFDESECEKLKAFLVRISDNLEPD